MKNPRISLLHDISSKRDTANLPDSTFETQMSLRPDKQKVKPICGSSIGDHPCLYLNNYGNV